MVMIMVVNLQLPVQAGAITIKFVSSNSIQVGGFLRVLRFPLQIKLTTTIYPVTEILLKVALNTINQPTLLWLNLIVSLMWNIFALQDVCTCIL